MYQNFKRTCRAVVLLIKPFVWLLYSFPQTYILNKAEGRPKRGTSSLTNGHPKNVENLNINLIIMIKILIIKEKLS